MDSAKTTEKGEIGEAMVVADLMRQGPRSRPASRHNPPYDLIVTGKENGRTEKIQVEYRKEVDWMAVYRATGRACYRSRRASGTASDSWRSG